MIEKDKNGPAHLKKIVAGLESNRKSVQTGNEISANISQAKEGFNEFEGIIRGQTGSINALKVFQKSMTSENTRALQIKKFFIGFADKLKTQITKLMKISEDLFSSSNQKSNKQQQYTKNFNEIMKLVLTLKEESDSSQKMYAAVYKLLNIKDNVLCQILRVMVYKKNVLWRDLNIKFDDYIHGEVKSILNKIKQNQQKFGYIPTSFSFKVPKPQIQYESSLFDLITITLQDQTELIDSLKNFSKLSQQPQLIEDISKNQHVVKGLRQKIQVLTNNYNSLLEKYRGLQISKGKGSHGPSQQKSLSQKIQQLETILIKKQQDIIELKQASMKSESAIQSLKDKNKQLEDEISKWQNYQLPKIKQLQFAQKTLLDEFGKTKRDFQTYSSLYQTEREDKIKAYSDLKDQRNRLNQMANILGRQRRKIKDLQAQLVRKDQIIFQIVQKAPDP